MIKTLIFDFGDVFINLNKDATFNALQKFGLTSFSDQMFKINEQYEIGKINTEDFLHFYKSVFPNVSEKHLIGAWNSILLDFPSYRLDFLKKLSEEKKYQLLLLSNTNELHINWVKTNISLYEEFKNCFDSFYLSHEIGLRKPNTSIFEFVLLENMLQTNECLFIDDTLEHINTAKKLGIHTWHLNPKTEDIINLFTFKKELF